MTDILLEANGLDIARVTHSILPALDCQVCAGEVVMLIGANGAGKSTLLAALAGDIKPRSGSLLLAGKSFADWSSTALAKHRTLLRQHSQLTLDFTVEEVVQMGGMMRACLNKELQEIAARMMSLTGVSHLAQCVVPSLSGGEQARVHLARVLTQLWPASGSVHPRLLLLDEPCASLDPYYQHLVCKVIREFAAQPGCGVVMTMHDMNLASQYADRIIALHKGQKIADGPVGEVLDAGLIRGCFEVDTGRWDHRDRGLLATLPL